MSYYYPYLTNDEIEDIRTLIRFWLKFTIYFDLLGEKYIYEEKGDISYRKKLEESDFLICYEV